MSDNQLAVEVVRGEMQPWSDYDSATSGLVLATLLNDVLPAGARTLVLGPHGTDLISVVLSKTSDATLLVRSVSDAEAAQSSGLRVVAGALDGLTGETFDVVVALDGLDRVLSYDSGDLDWSRRLDLLAAVAAPDAVVLLGLENEFALTTLLDQRPLDQRHGDNDWRPLHDDPSRPVSAVQLASELARVGLDARTVFSVYASQALLAVDVAAAARPGHLPTRLAAEALESTAVPLLTPLQEPTATAARAGLLASTCTSWLALTAPAPHAIYAQTGPAVLRATPASGWAISLAPVADPGAGGDVFFDASVVPAQVPDGISVETMLFRLAAAEDVPGFRALAARLGEWAPTSRVLLRWDDMIIDGDTFALGVSPWVTASDETREDLLAAAWQRFHERLISNHRRHPWPPWMVGDDLVSTWLAMSGVPAPDPTPAITPDTPPATTAQVARGKELAAALQLRTNTSTAKIPDVRTALADAERARRELFEQTGHIFGLERTLGFRDKALKTRENRLREMRLQVQKANADRTRFRNSRAFAAATLIRKAATIRNPRQFAAKAKRRLKRTLRRRFG